MAHANGKLRWETNKHGHSRAFSNLKHWHRTLFAVLAMHALTSLIYFTNLCTPIETYIYARKKHPFVSYPAAKHPNASNLQLQTYEKKQWTLFNNTARASTLSSRNNFQNLGSFAKVSVPVKNYNFLNVHIHTYKCIYIYSMCIYVI